MHVGRGGGDDWRDGSTPSLEVPKATWVRPKGTSLCSQLARSVEGGREAGRGLSYLGGQRSQVWRSPLILTGLYL